MKEATFKIDNMICLGCSEKITDILKEVDGVQVVKAKAMKKLVKVGFNPEKTDEETLVSILTKAGYKPLK